MANVYVRNSRFDSNGYSFVQRNGSAVQTWAGADILLAPSAGNSVRRCVSVNAGGAFVASPHHTSVNTATIEGCVIGEATVLQFHCLSLPFTAFPCRPTPPFSCADMGPVFACR